MFEDTCHTAPVSGDATLSMNSRSYYMRQKGLGILLALQLAHARETCHAWNLLPLPAPPYTADVMTGVQGASTKRAARTPCSSLERVRECGRVALRVE